MGAIRGNVRGHSVCFDLCDYYACIEDEEEKKYTIDVEMNHFDRFFLDDYLKENYLEHLDITLKDLVEMDLETVSCGFHYGREPVYLDLITFELEYEKNIFIQDIPDNLEYDWMDMV